MLLHEYAMENVVRNIHIRLLMIRLEAHLKLPRRHYFFKQFLFFLTRHIMLVTYFCINTHNILSIEFNKLCILD